MLTLLFALTFALLFGFAYAHHGAFDQSAINDSLSGECLSASAAVTASGTFPANALTGAGTVAFTNTTATPGTLTTRTAAQMYADLTAQLGSAPPVGYQYLLILAHGAAGTLTLAGGSGVTISSLTTGPTTVATVTSRAYLVTVVNPSTITIQSIGALAT